MTQTSGLTVRRHQRSELELQIEFAVADVHQEQVRFSAVSSAVDAHIVRGRATDISSGGVGWVSRHYVPRMCEGKVRVYDPVPTGTGPDGAPIYQVAFEHRVKVRRVIMRSHEPTYAIGASFIDPEATIDLQVEMVKRLALAKAERAAAAGEAGTRA